MRAALERLFADKSVSVRNVEEQLELLVEKGEINAADVPDQRTLYRWRERILGADDQAAEAWDWRTADPADARFVQAGLALAATGTQGRIATVDQEHAALMIRLHHLVPLLPPAAAWPFARDFLRAGDDAAHLDLALTFAQAVRLDGLEPATIRAHVNAHFDHWPERPLAAWAGSWGAAETYAEEIGQHASIDPKTGVVGGEESVWYVKFVFERARGNSDD